MNRPDADSLPSIKAASTTVSQSVQQSTSRWGCWASVSQSGRRLQTMRPCLFCRNLWVDLFFIPAHCVEWTWITSPCDTHLLWTAQINMSSLQPPSLPPSLSQSSSSSAPRTQGYNIQRWKSFLAATGKKTGGCSNFMGQKTRKKPQHIGSVVAAGETLRSLKPHKTTLHDGTYTFRGWNPNKKKRRRRFIFYNHIWF